MFSCSSYCFLEVFYFPHGPCLANLCWGLSFFA
jgi:hypothetical protein